MAYVPPHLRKDKQSSLSSSTTDSSIPVNPTFSPARKGITSRSPQIMRGQQHLFRSSTPTFTTTKARGRDIPKDRWYGFHDSRNDPQRKEQRQKWLAKTKEERERMGMDPTQMYENLQIEITGNNVPEEKINTFYDIDMGAELDQNIFKAGYCHPMPVQKVTIPIVMAKRDLMSCAQTGSGKTAAFLLPIISDILLRPPAPRDNDFSHRVSVFPVALILAPTRELGQQIHEEAIRFTENTPIRSVVIHGGAETYPQIKEMGQGCDILVATPGRLIHFMERKIVSLSAVKFLIFDEADRMLDMGFEPQIREIVSDNEMPPVGERQTLMFSATFPKQIQRLASDFLNDYVFITIGKEGSTVDSISQIFLWVNEEQKRDAILDVLEEFAGGNKKVVVFVETKKGCDMLEAYLYDNRYEVDSIHGDRSQADRDYCLKQFRENEIQILVATDVASRGLDIPDIELVVNYDMPQEIDSYIHRIGRTGRAGKTGMAVTFLNEKSEGMIVNLIPVLEEANQDIPEWLSEKAKDLRLSRSQGKRGGRGGRDFRRGRYGGRDRRYDNHGRRGNNNFDVNRSISTPVRPPLFED
ncbi:RNA helicase [Entamoeba marina]